MPVLIIGGEGPQGEEKKKPMGMGAKPMKPFKGIGGSFDSEESGSETEEAGAGSSPDAENVRMFFEAGKAGKYDRALEALRALVQSCCESGE